MRKLPRLSLALLLSTLAVAAVLAFDAPRPPAAPPDASDPPKDGRALYLEACASCHGADGTGTPQALLGFAVPVPDFTDCSFATREPDADWLAVTHQGGRARAFAPEMPAFGAALTEDELQRVLDYVRTLCPSDAWPHGELNLPRALVTEKAYPEDEAVFSSAIDVEGDGAVVSEVDYEQRFGARNQIEIVVPFAFREEEGGWTGGRLGGVAEASSAPSATTSGGGPSSASPASSSSPPATAAGPSCSSRSPRSGRCSRPTPSSTSRAAPRCRWAAATSRPSGAARWAAPSPPAALWYQPIAYRWAQNLAGYDAPQPRRFVAAYTAMADASALRLATAAATVR